jgi:hypothetical protein
MALVSGSLRLANAGELIQFSKSQAVIARSEATKQSILYLLRGEMDCFASLAMTASYFKHEPAFPRRDAPEVCMNHSPKENGGRGECRVPNAPAASRAK